MFITLEGPDGSGKTTAIKPIKEWLEAQGYEVLLTREPGGTKISEQIRNVILDNSNKEMDGWTEALLFIASRRQHLVQEIIPALKAGKIVVCDRYIDSTSAYQGAARGIDVHKLDEVQKLVLGEWMPDLTIYFDVDKEVADTRIDNRTEKKNRLDLEDANYKQKVVNGYKELIAKHPDRFRVVDANKDLDSVENQVKEYIMEALKNYDKK